MFQSRTMDETICDRFNNINRDAPETTPFNPRPLNIISTLDVNAVPTVEKKSSQFYINKFL